MIWLEKSGDPEKIEEVVRTAGNLGYRITKALNAGAEETGDQGGIGDPEQRGDLRKTGGLERTDDRVKTEGNLFKGVKNSAPDSRSLKSTCREFPVQ